jgi:hypothetical protein
MNDHHPHEGLKDYYSTYMGINPTSALNIWSYQHISP